MTSKLARHPLAWGMTRWGPLPGTGSLYLFWGGPGSGIYLEHGQDGPQQPVRHESASGTYDTVKAAQRAVEAFAAAGEESGEEEKQGGRR